MGAGLVQRSRAGFATLLNEKLRRTDGFSHLLVGSGGVGQLVQAGQVFLGYVVVGSCADHLDQHLPSVPILAQFHKRLAQAVHRLNIAWDRIQNILIDFSGVFPFTAQSQ